MRFSLGGGRAGGWPVGGGRLSGARPVLSLLRPARQASSGDSASASASAADACAGSGGSRSGRRPADRAAAPARAGHRGDRRRRSGKPQKIHAGRDHGRSSRRDGARPPRGAACRAWRRRARASWRAPVCATARAGRLRRPLRGHDRSGFAAGLVQLRRGIRRQLRRFGAQPDPAAASAGAPKVEPLPQ